MTLLTDRKGRFEGGGGGVNDVVLGGVKVSASEGGGHVEEGGIGGGGSGIEKLLVKHEGESGGLVGCGGGDPVVLELGGQGGLIVVGEREVVRGWGGFVGIGVEVKGPSGRRKGSQHLLQKIVVHLREGRIKPLHFSATRLHQKFRLESESEREEKKAAMRESVCEVKEWEVTAEELVSTLN